MARVLPAQIGVVAMLVALVTDTSDVDQPELLTPAEARALAKALTDRAAEIDLWAPHLRSVVDGGEEHVASP